MDNWRELAENNPAEFIRQFLLEAEVAPVLCKMFQKMKEECPNHFSMGFKSDDDDFALVLVRRGGNPPTKEVIESLFS